MGKFRKKPVIVDAIPYQAGMEDGVDDEGRPFIRTLEGPHLLQAGDWIITGVQGERYVIKDHIFRATYEPVDDEAQRLLREPSWRPEYVHGEAYCLLRYYCSACGRDEMIWNSRDGITPAVVPCRSCGQQARHEPSAGDQFAPEHEPKAGDRVFVDLTSERARHWANQRFESLLAAGKVTEAERTVFIDLASADMMAKGLPDLVEVREEDLPWRRR